MPAPGGRDGRLDGNGPKCCGKWSGGGSPRDPALVVAKPGKLEKKLFSWSRRGRLGGGARIKTTCSSSMSIGRSATPSSRKGPGRHTRRGPRTVLGLTCGSMSRTKRALWNLVLEHTAGDNWPMGPGHTSFLLAQLVWGSVFLDYLSTYFLIPSCNINAISEAYERHLRKPQNASFPNQNQIPPGTRGGNNRLALISNIHG